MHITGADRDPCGIDSFLLRGPPRVCQTVELGKVSLLWSHLSIGMGGVQIRHTYRGDDPQSAQFPPPQPKLRPPNLSIFSNGCLRAGKPSVFPPLPWPGTLSLHPTDL